MAFKGLSAILYALLCLLFHIIRENHSDDFPDSSEWFVWNIRMLLENHSDHLKNHLDDLKEMVQKQVIFSLKKEKLGYTC